MICAVVELGLNLSEGAAPLQIIGHLCLEGSAFIFLLVAASCNREQYGFYVLPKLFDVQTILA